MKDEEAALFANDVFYAAFKANDYDAMERLWAMSGIICVHPGWLPLYGREDVLESWQAILGEQGAPDVTCRAAKVSIFGESAVVTCIEDLNGAYLCATNVFVKEAADWKMVHHHAGPVNLRPEDLPDEPDIAVN